MTMDAKTLYYYRKYQKLFPKDYPRTSWELASNEELLRMKIRDLPNNLESSFLARPLKKFYRELQQKDILIKPNLWFSDEWFSPDNVAGIAVPFYFSHPRLMALEKVMTGKLDGENHTEILKILRHEMGHVFESVFHTRQDLQRRKLFGVSSKKYPKSYKAQIFSRSYVHNLCENYAQAHPDEDFAETFAVVLDSKSQWRKKYKNKTCLTKLKYIDTLLKRYKNKKPRGLDRNIYLEIAKNRKTLASRYKTPMAFNLSKDLLLAQKALWMARAKVHEQAPQYLLKAIWNHFSEEYYQKQKLHPNFRKNYLQLERYLTIRTRQALKNGLEFSM
jgi:hypothetical protein